MNTLTALQPKFPCVLFNSKRRAEMKSLYEKYCFAGTVFCGRVSDDAPSAKITEIVISEKEATVHYEASPQHLAWIDKQNLMRAGQAKLEPIQNESFPLVHFLCAIRKGTITVLSIPKN